MKNFIFAIALILLCRTDAVFATQPNKIILIMFENTDYSGAMADPNFSKFAQQGVLLNNYFAVGHPSQPNYVALVAGSMMGVSSDNDTNLAGNSFADLLAAKGKTWHVYAESFPGRCSLSTSKGTYYRKHNPLISFTNIQKNSASCANITDATNFGSDFNAKRLADFNMYIPDINNDGHDTNATYAGNWFNQTFGALINDPVAMSGVMLVATFDEDDSILGGGTNQVYAVMYGPDLAAGTQISTHYDHIDMLRTFEDIFQVGTLGREDAARTPIAGYLKP